MKHTFVSCREKKDAEISGLEQERNRELEELQQLEKGNMMIREKVTNIVMEYNRSVSTGTVPYILIRDFESVSTEYLSPR